MLGQHDFLKPARPDQFDSRKQSVEILEYLFSLVAIQPGCRGCWEPERPERMNVADGAEAFAQRYELRRSFKEKISKHAGLPARKSVKRPVIRRHCIADAP